MWRKSLLMLFIGFSVGCTSSISTIPTHTSDPEINHAVTPSSTNLVFTPRSTDTSLTQITIPYQETQVFKERTDLRLLIRTSENRLGVMNLSKMEIENEYQLSDSIVSYPVINEDGVLMAQINRQNDKKLLQIKNLSTDEESWVDLPEESVLAKWLNNTKLAIWGGPTAIGCLSLLLIYDDFTTSTSYPPHPMPELQKTECIQLPLLTTDGTKMIYPWKMFDFQTGISINAFSFMESVPENPPSYSLREANKKISIAYVNGDKLIYLLNVPLANINEVGINPKVVLLPGLATKNGWWQPFSWWPSRMQIGIDLIDQEVDPLQLLVSGQYAPTNFYFVDFATNKIFDYDLDRAVFTEGSLPQRINYGFPSPDGRYFAWTIYDGSSGLPIGIKVLELSSGFVISIPELEMLGWVSPPRK